ncbi:MAG: hypothetical protein AOA66_0771 [Candidatus Bathyarchaeota archaeon BA2]|nr:MAG: hypothetical protein AOA66_0771 [Candidatus Bathyarchaeota archaeon BA2]
MSTDVAFVILSEEQRLFPIYTSEPRLEVTDRVSRAVDSAVILGSIPLHPRSGEKDRTELSTYQKMQDFNLRYPTITFEATKELPALVETGKEEGVRLEKVRELMKNLTPVKVKLKPGFIIKLTENLIAEKTTDGNIILYEVVR